MQGTLGPVCEHNLYVPSAHHGWSLGLSHERKARLGYQRRYQAVRSPHVLS
jgi:hypothetical protein